MSPRDDEWLDEDAGRVARPYTVTGGRTRPRGERQFDLIDIVVATRHRHILSVCQRPTVVAELTAAVGLPLGLVRVLLADLHHEDLISVSRQARRTDQRLLQRVLDSLKAL
jgi:hypothetical protein